MNSNNQWKVFLSKLLEELIFVQRVSENVCAIRALYFEEDFICIKQVKSRAE